MLVRNAEITVSTRLAVVQVMYSARVGLILSTPTLQMSHPTQKWSFYSYTVELIELRFSVPLDTIIGHFGHLPANLLAWCWKQVAQDRATRKSVEILSAAAQLYEK